MIRFRQACGIPLYLSKKGAFGSGEHETTAACLRQLEKITTLQGCRALDLGSGTGILAIAALLLGAESAIAIDIEWPAAFSCSMNALLNGVENRVLTVCGELETLSCSGFDLVMANIYADILMPLADSSGRTDLLRRSHPSFRYSAAGQVRYLEALQRAWL